MSTIWLNAFEELKRYTADNPGIEIIPNAVCIPADVRPEFYRLFNAVCLSFITDKFPGYLENGKELSRAWKTVSQAVTNNLGLEELKVPDGSKWFLMDPADGLTRVLIDPLFDVLKGKADLAGFEQNATAQTAVKFTTFFCEGYRLWCVISLIQSISADRAYTVPAVDYYEPSMADFTDLRPGTHKELVPEPRETRKIAFEHVPLCTFLVPTVIVNAPRLGSYAAFRAGFCEARWQARNVSGAQEWFAISDINREFGQGEQWPDLCIYINGNLKELTLVADYYQVAQPDIIIECRESNDWYQKEGLLMIKRHYDVLRPRLGSFVICRQPVPEGAIRELNPQPGLECSSIRPDGFTQNVPNITLMNAGYEPCRLEPVLKAMMNVKNGKDTPAPG
jgi:hypothetical protein